MTNKYEYQFKFDDGSMKTFDIDIDSNTGYIFEKDDEPGPDWTRLEFKKCSHCQYKTGEREYCPVAKNLAKASEAFKEHRSFVQLNAFVSTDERLYGKRTDLQTALFSLFGLIMASSPCQHLSMFKAMARFHLPFSTVEETTLRTFGTCLLLEYIKQVEDPQHKITLNKLAAKYADINIVNKSIIERVRSISDGDANKNALIILDSFCTLLPLEIDSGLGEVKSLLSHIK